MGKEHDFGAQCDLDSDPSFISIHPPFWP